MLIIEKYLEAKLRCPNPLEAEAGRSEAGLISEVAVSASCEDGTEAEVEPETN